MAALLPGPGAAPSSQSILRRHRDLRPSLQCHLGVSFDHTRFLGATRAVATRDSPQFRERCPPRSRFFFFRPTSQYFRTRQASRSTINPAAGTARHRSMTLFSGPCRFDTSPFASGSPIQEGQRLVECRINHSPIPTDLRGGASRMSKPSPLPPVRSPSRILCWPSNPCLAFQPGAGEQRSRTTTRE